MAVELTISVPDRVGSYVENLAMREEVNYGLVIVRAICMLYTIEQRRMDGEKVWVENAEESKRQGKSVYSQLSIPWHPMFDKEIDFDGLLDG